MTVVSELRPSFFLVNIIEPQIIDKLQKPQQVMTNKNDDKIESSVQGLVWECRI